MGETSKQLERIYYFQKDLANSRFDSAFDNLAKRLTKNSLMDTFILKAEKRFNDWLGVSDKEREARQGFYDLISNNFNNANALNTGNVVGKLWTGGRKIRTGDIEASFYQLARRMKFNAGDINATVKNLQDNFLNNDTLIKEYKKIYNEFLRQLYASLGAAEQSALRDILRGYKPSSNGTLNDSIYANAEKMLAEKVKNNKAIGERLRPQELRAFILGKELVDKLRNTGPSVEDKEISLAYVVYKISGILNSVGGGLSEYIGAECFKLAAAEAGRQITTSLTGTKSADVSSSLQEVANMAMENHVSKGDITINTSVNGINISVPISFKASLKKGGNPEGMRGLKLLEGGVWKDALTSYGIVEGSEDMLALGNAVAYHYTIDKRAIKNENLYKKALTLVNKMGIYWALTGADEVLFLNINGRFYSIVDLLKKVKNDETGRQFFSFSNNQVAFVNAWEGEKDNYSEQLAMERTNKVISKMYQLHLSTIKFNNLV